LSSIGPTPDPEPRPRHWNENEYCQFHRGRGHTTENCYRLKHKIQDLIEEGTIPIPNNKKNPLSSNAIFIDDGSWVDCSKLINPKDREINGIWHSDDEDEVYIAVPIRKSRSKPTNSNTGVGYHNVAHTYQASSSKKNKKKNKSKPKSPTKLFQPSTQSTVVLNDPSVNTSTIVQNNPSTTVQNSPSTTVQNGPSTTVQNGPATTVLNGPSVNSTSTITMGSTSISVPNPPLTQITPFEVIVGQAGKAHETVPHPSYRDIAVAAAPVIIPPTAVKPTQEPTPFQKAISTWDLITESYDHRNMLLKTLRAIPATRDLPPNQLLSHVTSNMTDDSINFRQSELPKFGPNHNLPLHIMVSCRKKNVP